MAIKAVVVIAVIMLLAGCSDGSGSDSNATSETSPGSAEVAGSSVEATTAPSEVPEPSGSASRLRPGNNQPVTVGRSGRLEDHFSAAIYLRLLRELGYRAEYFEQQDGSDLLAPAQAFQALAVGRIDVWPGGVFPQHDPFLSDPVAGGEGALVADRVSVIGQQMLGGLIEGVLVSRDWAEANGVTRLDDIAANPALGAAFDVDGDGGPDIFGCREGTTCQILLDRLIAEQGWPFTQMMRAPSADASLLDAAVERLGAGQPTLVFGRSPGESLARLAPGVATLWLSVANPVEGSAYNANLSSRLCPASTCNTGFPAADILTVANNDFLAANPSARELLARVQLSAADVSQQSLLITEETSTADVDNGASRWITENRELVNQWLDAARDAV